MITQIVSHSDTDLVMPLCAMGWDALGELRQWPAVMNRSDEAERSKTNGGAEAMRC